MRSFEKQKKMPDKASPSKKQKKVIKFTINPKQKEKIAKHRLIKQKETSDKETPDVVSEQKEDYYTTMYCPESIKDVKLIKQHPEDYLEINIIKKSRVVDTFAIPVDKKIFHYKKKEYRVVEEGIYLLPTKSGLLMPSSFYREGIYTPTGFKNTNKGITGKALSLLYMEQLYTSLLYGEDTKYNLFIVILLLACLVAFAVACYFVFIHGGGIVNPSSVPIQPLPPEGMIRPW